MALPAVTDPVLAVGVVAVVSFTALRLYAWRAATEPPRTAMRRIRVAVGTGSVLTGVAALLAAVAADALDLTGSALRAASPALADSPVGAVLTWVPTVLGVALAVSAGYLGAFPYVREVRELDVSAVSAAWSVAKVVAVFFGLLAAAVGAMNLAPEGAFASTLPGVTFLAAFVAVLLAIQPRVVAVLNDAREPTGEERERLARCCETADLSPRDVRVLDTGGDRVAAAMLPGLPGRRRLFVTDDLLDGFDDEGVTAVLAARAGTTAHYYREAKFGVLLAVGGLFVGVQTGELPALTGLDSGVLTVAVVVVAVTLLRVGRRLVFVADDYAVERVGAETYVRTLEALADEHHLSYESGRLRSLLSMRPSLGARLDRLWGRMDE